MEEDRRQEENHRDLDRPNPIEKTGLFPRIDVAPRLWVYDKAHVALQVDTTIYCVDALLRAAYKFTDRAYIFIGSDQDRADSYIVFVAAKDPQSDAESVVCDFVNDLLDQQLRERLEKQFGNVRTLIVAQAFAEGNLLDRDRDDGDYITDPRGIARPR